MGALRVTRPDGTFTLSEIPFEIPSVFFQPKGVTHKEEGIGPPDRHSIMIDLKNTQVTCSAPRNDIAPAFPRENSKSVLESPRILVWDATWRPDQEIVPYLHGTDTVVVFLKGGTIRIK